jgi:SAM-dependent methyltransferase
VTNWAGKALRKFRDANVALSWKTTPAQLWESRAYAMYDWVARAELGRPGTNVVVDIGGGRTWHFGDEYRRNPDFRLIGVDIDPGELALNQSLDQAVTADVCRTLGVPDNSVDLVLGRAVVEHLHDTSAFLEGLMRALKPGGRAVLVFANRWSPPMILNQIIPHRVSERLLLALVPGTSGICGFKAHYDKCSFPAFKRAARRAGFEIPYEYVGYYSSSYFQFFWPVHLISIAGDLLRQMLSIRVIGSMNLFVIQKPAAGSESGPG